MFYVKYPSDPEFCTWQDIGYLCTALGFPSMLIQHTLKAKMKLPIDGLPLQRMRRIIEERKLLDAAVDRTYNLHTDEWNLLLMEKALDFVYAKILSYPDLHLIRLAYQSYEMDDSKGMMLDTCTLQRSLKLCNRMISPLKMLHRLKHMKKGFADRERIQLHEYLDLLLWCDVYKQGDYKVQRDTLITDKFDLYELKDFDYLLSHHDERLRYQLDDGYLRDEWKFATPQTHVTPLTLKEHQYIPPVHTHNRINMAIRQKKKYVYLKREIDLSTSDVYQSRAGYLRPTEARKRGIGLAEFFKKRPLTQPPRPLSVRETLSRLTTTTESKSQDYILSDDAAPQSEVTSTRPQTAPTVTELERKYTQNEMNNLKFDMEILICLLKVIVLRK